MNQKEFDLNIEEILVDWQPYHAVREIISNALDEKVLSKSKEIKIFKDEKGSWHVRDFGRGVRREHLTQNENQEKLGCDNLIGKFGIGLKDAIATFNRHGIQINIQSKHENITTRRMSKSGFDDIQTIHAILDDPVSKNMEGTDVIISGISDEEVQKALDLFIQFSSSAPITKTQYGEIYQKIGEKGIIYINGLKVAEENNFLFSYNITSLNSQIKKSLNRERTNVGRTAYSERVKSILLSTQDETVASILAEEFSGLQTGEMSDELNWIDVQYHAIEILNSMGTYVFMTQLEAFSSPDAIDEIKRQGKSVLVVPENLRSKISGSTDKQGNLIVDFDQFIRLYNDDFDYHFIDEKKLTKFERKVLAYQNKILKLIGGLPSTVSEIKISSNIRTDFASDYRTDGVYDSKSRLIVLHRRVLMSLSDFAGILTHEVTHARTGLPDVNRGFESELTKVIGQVIEKMLR